MKKAKSIRNIIVPLIFNLIVLSMVAAIYVFISSREVHAEILTKPYLQAVTANSIYILVETNSGESLMVDYGETKKYGSKAKDEFAVKTKKRKPTYVHRIKLKGLQANTNYYYKVTGKGKTISQSSFTTAANPGTSFKFAVQGDSRSNPKIFAKVMKGIAGHNPRFALYTGDIAYDSAYETWKKEFFIEEQMEFAASAAFFNAVGNHEGWTQNTKAFTQAPESASGRQDYYSFEYGDLYVLVLNTQASLNFSKGQLKFAAESLKNTKRIWKIVVYHIPAYGAGGHGESKTMINVSKKIFEPLGVDIVLNGHSHFYQRNYVNGVYHIIMAGGGAPLYTPKKAKYTQKSVKKHHFGIFDVSSSTLQLNVYGLNGNIIDILMLTK